MLPCLLAGVVTPFIFVVPTCPMMLPASVSLLRHPLARWLLLLLLLAVNGCGVGISILCRTYTRIVRVMCLGPNMLMWARSSGGWQLCLIWWMPTAAATLAAVHLPMFTHNVLPVLIAFMPRTTCCLMLLCAQCAPAPSATTVLSRSLLQHCTPLLLEQGCAVCALLSCHPPSSCSASLLGWKSSKALSQRTIMPSSSGGPSSNGALLHAVVGFSVPAASCLRRQRLPGPSWMRCMSSLMLGMWMCWMLSLLLASSLWLLLGLTLRMLHGAGALHGCILGSGPALH